MGDTKLTFKRYEEKYLLSHSVFLTLFAALEDYIRPDEYFRSTVCSIYYDTDDYSLIRHSIEGPVYKEKLRLRSYNVPAADGKVFIELKKKFKGIVYKRRISSTAAAATAYLSGKGDSPDSQVGREIDWFLKENPVIPRAFIACDRSAYVANDNPELRITFDENLRWRDYDLDITAGDYGELLTEPGDVLMEIKIPGAAPIWLSRLLSELGIFPTSFSKYGTCYKASLINKFFTE